MLIATRIKMIATFALCIALLCVTATAVLAQSTTQGAIGGTVFDPTNAAIVNATVTIHNDATNAERLRLRLLASVGTRRTCRWFWGR